jgi:hypothetical protein
MRSVVTSDAHRPLSLGLTGCSPHHRASCVRGCFEFICLFASRPFFSRYSFVCVQSFVSTHLCPVVCTGRVCTGRTGQVRDVFLRRVHSRSYFMTKLFVRCPSCGNHMRSDPRNVLTAVKRCVYCGTSFKIHTPGGVSRILFEDAGKGPLKTPNSKITEAINPV